MKKNLSRGERKIAADVFHYLVTPNGSKIAHSVGDLAYYTRRKQNKVQEVLGRLSASDTRIIRAISQAPDTENVQRFEIFHDVLAPAVLEWRRRFLERRFLVLAEVLIGFGLSTIVLSLLFFIGVELRSGSYSAWVSRRP